MKHTHPRKFHKILTLSVAFILSVISVVAVQSMPANAAGGWQVVVMNNRDMTIPASYSLNLSHSGSFFGDVYNPEKARRNVWGYNYGNGRANNWSVTIDVTHISSITFSGSLSARHDTEWAQGYWEGDKYIVNDRCEANYSSGSLTVSAPGLGSRTICSISGDSGKSSASTSNSGSTTFDVSGITGNVTFTVADTVGCNTSGWQHSNADTSYSVSVSSN